MRRSVVVALAIFVVTALGGLEYAHWRMRPKPPIVVAAAAPSPEAAAGRADCALACDRLRICRHPAAGADCPRVCQEGWSHEKAVCVQTSGCAELDQKCALETTEISCAQACQRAAECRLLDTRENCEALCRKEWDQDKRRCMLETVCEEIPAVCWPAAASTPCATYCDRLVECDYVKRENEPDCVDSCLTVDDPLLRDCAARVSCEMIELVCMSSNYDPACLDACDRAQRCGALRNTPRDSCIADCLVGWNDATKNCVLSRTCDEVGAACLAQPDQACVEVCRKLMSCKLETDQADCAAVCTTDLPEETRSCINEQPCESIDSACFGGGPDLCRMACEKAASCGLEQDPEGCRTVCQESDDPQLVSCILSLPCAAIPKMCFGAAAEEAPTPTPLPPPYRSYGLPPYSPNPDRTPFPSGPAKP